MSLGTVFAFFKDILPGLVSLVAVIVSGCAVSQTRKTQLTATYFSEKTRAYSDYLDSVARFVFHPCNETRDNIASALYRVQLFAPGKIASAAQNVYVVAIDWSHSDKESALGIDELVNELGSLMRADLASFDHRR